MATSARRDREGRAYRPLGAALAVLFAIQSYGQDNQRWVTDRLEVDLRRGQSIRHAITRMVPAGTAVQVLEQDSASGYSRVRTPSGAEGWILSRYLQPEPPARLRVPDLEQQLAEAKRELTGLRAQTSTLHKERDELQRKGRALEAAASSLQKDLAAVREVSADTLRIHEENRRLRAQLADSEQRIAELEAAHRELRSRSNRDWFLAGAGVLGTGIGFGLVVPRLRWRRRSDWNRL